MSKSLSMAQLIINWNNLISMIKVRIERRRVKVYRSNGEDTVQVKEWYGSMKPVNGVWSFNIANANFVEILFVEAYAIYNDTNFNNQALVSYATQTLTFVSGRVVTGDTGGLFNSNSLRQRDVNLVYVKVTGH